LHDKKGTVPCFARLVRARQRIHELGLPFAVPDASELPSRINGLLGTLYLLFNEGYKASSGDQLVREDLCHEAIRLTKLLSEHSATNQPRTHALLSLMYFNASRLTTRTSETGQILRLHEQDRSAWDQRMIQKGAQHLSNASTGDEVSEYHLSAGIAACHCLAKDDRSTDWPRVLMLYDHLSDLTNSPIVAMSRAVAVARVHGSQAGMDALNAITHRDSLKSYHLYHVIYGTFAAELGMLPIALTHFRQAGDLASLPAEREFIERRIEEVKSSNTSSSQQQQAAESC
jgi:predicted RNA polymerase sigma factor